MNPKYFSKRRRGQGDMTPKLWLNANNFKMVKATDFNLTHISGTIRT